VRYVERRGGKWFVHYQALDEGREDFNASDMFVTADIVMLGAGTLGSTEILLRSKALGLPLSDCLGERFSGNGDVLGFSYNGSQEVNGIGFGHRKPGEIPPVGPCITGVIDIRNQPTLEDGMVVEEGSIPGALASLMPGLWRRLPRRPAKTRIPSWSASSSKSRESWKAWSAALSRRRPQHADLPGDDSRFRRRQDAPGKRPPDTRMAGSGH